LQGLNTLNIVRRDAAARLVRDAGGDRVIVSGDDLPAQIADALDGAELGLVLDGTAGPTVADLAYALKFRCTAVTYAFVTDTPPSVAATDLTFKEITLTGFWLINWLRQAPRAEIENLPPHSPTWSQTASWPSRSRPPTTWTTTTTPSNTR
jgi:NADPH:quinone reductase-like Zn-dependent oxidoreductase